MLLPFLPLFLLVLLAISLATRGPILVVEHAYSCSSQPIRNLRFRTRDHGFGPFLTRSGLDQFPMLISVLRGDMSIVGPHRYVLPPQPADDQAPPALVNAPFLPDLVSFELQSGEATDLDADLFYVLNWSLRLDAEIVFQHLFSKKAYIRNTI